MSKITDERKRREGSKAKRSDGRTHGRRGDMMEDYASTTLTYLKRQDGIYHYQLSHRRNYFLDVVSVANRRAGFFLILINHWWVGSKLGSSRRDDPTQSWKENIGVEYPSCIEGSKNGRMFG
jgi:hypothetical protein